MKRSMKNYLMKAVVVAVAATSMMALSCQSDSPTAVAGLATISITPIGAMAVNTSQQLIADGRDANGMIVAINPVWSVVAGGGSISTSGVFTAGAVAGNFANTVQASVGNIAGHASVTVTVLPPVLATITVTPGSITLAAGATQQFSAVGKDASGNIIAIVPVWAVMVSGGSFNVSGLFTAGSTGGTYTNTIKASSGAISGFASVTVTTVAPLGVDLGAAAPFAILAASTVTCVNLGVVNADLGLYPGTAVTGFPPCTYSGSLHAGDPAAQAAQVSLGLAYLQVDAMPCGATITTDLGGQTLAPGVWCSLSTVGLTGQMFLDAQGNANALFVIKAPSSLTTAAAQVTLLNGAQAKNVYWLVGSSATLGVGSVMKGNILAYASISLVDNATLSGRALAENGAVTLGTSNTITLP